MKNSNSYFFDEDGFCIYKKPVYWKLKHYDAPYSQPDQKLTMKQPTIDYLERINNLKLFAKEFNILTHPAWFEDRSCKLIEEVKASEELKNLHNGVCLPIMFPPLGGEYIRMLDMFILAVGRSYRAHFPGQQFINGLNSRRNEGHTFSWTRTFRDDRALFDQGPCVALFYPFAMQGFSASRARTIIHRRLPKRLYLNGGIDTAIAATMYPELLGCPAPSLQCAGTYNGSDDTFRFFSSPVHAQIDLLSFYGAHKASSKAGAGLLFV